MLGVLAERSVYAVACQVGRAVDDGHVGLCNLSVLELAGDLPLGAVVLGYYHHTSSVSVESMHDSWAELAESAGQLVGIEGQCVDECAASVAPGGVDENTGLLVEYDDILVFMHDIEWDIFGRDFPGRGLGKRQLDSVACGELEALSDGLAVDEDGACFDCVLQESPAKVAESTVQIFIDPAFLDGVADAQDQRL